MSRILWPVASCSTDFVEVHILVISILWPMAMAKICSITASVIRVSTRSRPRHLNSMTIIRLMPVINKALTLNRQIFSSDILDPTETSE